MTLVCLISLLVEECMAALLAIVHLVWNWRLILELPSRTMFRSSLESRLRYALTDRTMPLFLTTNLKELLVHCFIVAVAWGTNLSPLVIIRRTLLFVRWLRSLPYVLKLPTLTNVRFRPPGASRLCRSLETPATTVLCDRSLASRLRRFADLRWVLSS